jgi:L-Ala-D/L-Glu epimerase
MKIRDVRVRVLRIPRLSTLTTPTAATTDAVTVLVELDTDDGLVGYGQVGVDHPSYGETAVGVVANVVRHLGPALLGHDPRDVTRSSTACTRRCRTTSSPSPRSRWRCGTLTGKALGAPVWRLLGGRVRPAST